MVEAFVVTGLPALLIILVILLLLGLGIYTLVRGGAKAASKVAHHDEHPTSGP